MKVYKCGPLFFDATLIKDPSELEEALDVMVEECTDEQMSDLWNVYAERVNNVGEELGLFGGEIGEKWSDGASYVLEDNGVVYEFGFAKAGGVYAIVMRAVSVDAEAASQTIITDTTLEYIPSEAEIRQFIREN